MCILEFHLFVAGTGSPAASDLPPSPRDLAMLTASRSQWPRPDLFKALNSASKSSYGLIRTIKLPSVTHNVSAVLPSTELRRVHPRENVVSVQRRLYSK